MPWTAQEATNYTKAANTPEKKRKWAKIANAALKTYGEKGAGKAIATANAAMHDRFWLGDEFFQHAFQRMQERQERRVADAKEGQAATDGRRDYRPPFLDAVYDREFTPAERAKAAEEGVAMPGGGYPIRTRGDLENAIEAIGRAKNRTATIRHIKQRARALGLVKLIPETWTDSAVEMPEFPKHTIVEHVAPPAPKQLDVAFVVKDEMRECPNCDGEGEIEGVECDMCDGEGEVEDEIAQSYDKKNKFAEDKAAELKKQFADAKADEKKVNAYLATLRKKDEATSFTDHAKALETFKPPTRMVLFDKIDAKDANVSMSKDGYLTAMPPTARTGIQLYTGEEVGMPEMPIVRVYRPPEEVFSKEALRSFAHKPVTLDHPMEDVDSTNWKKYAVGHTGDEILRDGERFRVPMTLMDQKAIKAYQDGTRQLSWGYDCSLDWTGGVTPDGQPYDAAQRGLRANHLAVVDLARGGSQLRIGDSSPTGVDDNRAAEGDNAMTAQLKTLTVDGLDFQVDAQAATLIQRSFADHDKQVDALKKQIEALDKKVKQAAEEEEDRDNEDKKKDAAIKERDEALKAKDAEVVTLKKQLADAQEEIKPAALNKRVVELLDTIKKGKAIMGDKLIVDGKDVAEIRRQVVEAKVGGQYTKDWDDKQILASFMSIQAPADSRNVLGPSGPSSHIDEARAVFGRPGPGYQTVETVRDKAYQDYDNDLANAWRGRQHVTQ